MGESPNLQECFRYQQIIIWLASYKISRHTRLVLTIDTYNHLLGVWFFKGERVELTVIRAYCYHTLLSTALGVGQSFIHCSFSDSTVPIWSHLPETLTSPIFSPPSVCSARGLSCPFGSDIISTSWLKWTCFSSWIDFLSSQGLFSSHESTPFSSPEDASVIFNLLFWCRDVKKATRLGSEGVFQRKMI